MRARLHPFSILFLLIVSAASPLFAQPAQIRGRVVDPAGAPLAGSVVRLLDNGAERARTTTSANGEFSVEGGCARCVIEVVHDGYLPLTVAASTARELAVTMGARPTVRESVVVTATGRETAASDVGASISTVDREEIEQRHALSTIDLLRTTPGVVAVRTGGVGNLTSLFVRGGESTYNKILLDGMPLNEPGGFFNLSSLSPENIDRIEVLRGAHSALFGSDAMASVVQIFTARPASGKPQVNLVFDGGTYNTTHMSAGVGAVQGPSEYSLFASHLQTDNRAPNNVNKTSTLSGLTTVRLQSGTARAIGRGDFGRAGVPGATAFGRADMDASFEHQDGELLGGWNQPLGSRTVHQASYSVAMTHQRSTNLVTDAPYTPRFGDLVAAFSASDFLYDSSTRLQRHHVNYRIDYMPASNQTVTAAFDYDGERGVLTNHRSTAAPQRPRRNNTGTTIQYETSARSVSLVGGVRFENNDSFGFYAAPRVAASWAARPGTDTVGSTRVHASAGRGIKEPTFLQSFSPSRGFLGNPDLLPERARGFDAGIEQRFVRERVGLELTYFANHFDDLISLGPFDPVTFDSQYLNIGETRASGLELSGDAVVSGALRIRGSYTLLDSEVILQSNTSSPIFAAGRALYRRPRHSGNLLASYTRGAASVMVGAIFVGSRIDTDFYFPSIERNNGYATWNASGEYRVNKGLSMFLAFENLADRDYMEPLGYPGLGRTVRIGARLRF